MDRRTTPTSNRSERLNVHRQEYDCRLNGPHQAAMSWNAEGSTEQMQHASV